MSVDTVGFVGLGNMGSVLAGNLVEPGHDVMSHDVSGPSRSPAGAEFVTDVTQLARRTDVIVLTIAIYALIGVAADAIARLLERRLLAWHPNYGGSR